MSGGWRKAALLAAWTSAVALAPSSAAAQPDETTADEAGATPAREPTKEALAAARALFVEGKELEAEDQWAEALDRFERVAKVKMTPQVRFHIALCHEKLGRWVDAINGFELATQEAQKMGDKAEEVWEAAPPRAEALRAKVPHLRLTIEGTVRTSKLYIDGREVSLALAGTKVPVDPGEHAVEVRRDGEVTQSQSLTLRESETRDLILVIDDPEPIEPKPEPDDPKPEPEPPPPPAEEGIGQWPAYVVGGVGAAGLVVAGVLYGLRNATIGEVRCSDGFSGCNPEDRDKVDQARGFDLGSKVSLGVGAGLLATGVVLWFVLWDPADGDPASTGNATTVSLAPYADGGAQLRIRF